MYHNKVTSSVLVILRVVFCQQGAIPRFVCVRVCVCVYRCKHVNPIAKQGKDQETKTKKIARQKKTISDRVHFTRTLQQQHNKDSSKSATIELRDYSRTCYHYLPL